MTFPWTDRGIFSRRVRTGVGAVFLISSATMFAACFPPPPGSCQWKYAADGAGSFTTLYHDVDATPLSALSLGGSFRDTSPYISLHGYTDFDGNGLSDPVRTIDAGDGSHRWQYRPDGGLGPWANLAKGPPLANLRFGDFNGDGKTDVFTAIPRSGGGADWKVSYSGTGALTQLAIGPRLADLRFGDFNGDARTDVFTTVSRGGDPIFGAHDWKVSYGGTGSFVNLAVGPALFLLRFGDFNADGKTDVFTAVNRTPPVSGSFQYQVSYGGTGSFVNLGVGPSLDRLRLGNFRGNARTDLFTTVDRGDEFHDWMMSDAGRGSFSFVATGPPLENLRFGYFGTNNGFTDVFTVTCPP